jgi:hypothetical protein
MRARPIAIILAASIAGLMAGCAAGPQGAQVRGNATDAAAGPRALLARWHKALVAGDKNAYIACFTGSDDEIVLALAGMEAVQANYAFHDAVVKEFGQGAWQGFVSGPAQIDIFPKEETWPGRITAVQTGAVAFGYLPRGRVPLHMIEEGGQWHIAAASLVPPGLLAKQAADYQMRWAASLRKLTQQVVEKKAPAAPAEASKNYMDMVAPAERGAAGRAVMDSFMTQ